MVLRSVLVSKTFYSKCNLFKLSFFFNTPNNLQYSHHALRFASTNLISKQFSFKFLNNTLQFTLKNAKNFFHSSRVNSKNSINIFNSQVTRSFKRTVPVKVSNPQEEKSLGIFKR